MLRHISGDRFEADTGQEIQIVTTSSSNDGVNDARFEYDSRVLPRATIQGLPGARFTVKGGRKQLQAVVMFADGVAATARYDLFEVDEVGGLSDLGQSVTRNASMPLVGLAVEGVAAVAAGAGPRRGAAPARRGTRKKAAARKTRKKGAKKRQKKTSSPSQRRGGKRR